MATKEKSRQKSPLEVAVHALGHRLRVEALTIFNERVASPREVAEELGQALPVVGHHVKVLLQAECIELVGEKTRGGAVEHFYRATRRPDFDAEAWQALSSKDKKEIATITLRNLFGEVIASVQMEKLSTDPHMYVWWKATNLDEQGRAEVEEEQTAHIARLQEIESRSNARMVQGGGEGGESAVLAVLGFTRGREGQPIKERLAQS